MSPRLAPGLLLLLVAMILPGSARGACEDLAGTRYYAPCIDQRRERETRHTEGARREEQRLQDVERRQQAIDERVRQLEREQRLDEMRRRMGPPDLH